MISQHHLNVISTKQIYFVVGFTSSLVTPSLELSAASVEGLVLSPVTWSASPKDFVLDVGEACSSVLVFVGAVPAIGVVTEGGIFCDTVATLSGDALLDETISTTLSGAGIVGVGNDVDTICCLSCEIICIGVVDWVSLSVCVQLRHSTVKVQFLQVT